MIGAVWTYAQYSILTNLYVTNLMRYGKFYL